MQRIIKYVILVLNVFPFVVVGQGELDVKLVQVLFRHGERTPIPKELYPNDIYNISHYQPWGLGQLTNDGKLREYKIGQMLRTRYNDYLGSIYKPTDIYALSTDFDRTKSSLHLVLAGLFPPSNSQLWNTKLPWLAIPTHYVPHPIDNLMRPHLCPHYKTLHEEVKNSPEIQQKVNVHKTFFEFLSKKTGWNITNTGPVYNIYNLFLAQKSLNLTIPAWCTDEIFEKMAEITALNYDIRSYTTTLKRLNGGTMVRRFIENMNADPEQNPWKMYLYSGHEVNVAAIMRTHSIEAPEPPLFGSAIIVEKLQDKGGNYFVRLLFWASITDELKILKLPGCEELCPLNNYLTIMQHVIPTDDEIDCLWKQYSKEEIQKFFVVKFEVK